MKEFRNTIQLIFAAVGGCLGWFLGGAAGRCKPTNKVRTGRSHPKVG